MQTVLERLFAHRRLERLEARTLMLAMADGEGTPEQVAAALAAFRMRPLALSELLGFRDALLERCLDPGLDAADAVDLCGTGGDGKDSFNVSTLAAFVVAGAGYRVVKHGNYGVSSSCGSSNVLEALGLRFSADPAVLRAQLEGAGIAFLHAPLFHPALARVAPVRRALGVRTLFNLLGPLVNPARPGRQLTGVFGLELARLYQYALQEAGTAFCVVHSLDGYDEVSLTGAFRAVTPNGPMDLRPEDLGLPTLAPEALHGGGTVAASAALFRAVLEGGGTEAQRAVVLANAALAIGTFHPGRPFADNLREAAAALDDGRAYAAFRRLVALSGEDAPPAAAPAAGVRPSAEGQAPAAGRLTAILDRTRTDAAARRTPSVLADLRARAADAPPARGFRAALAAAAPGVIAEFKRRSPSAGGLAPAGAEPDAVARAYAAAGAAALSVLTDGPHFGGSLDDLQRARAAVDLPVLRKDFLLDAAQLVEARAAGADAVLLIAEALEAPRLADLHDEARALGLDVLIELHGPAALERLPANAELIGVNHRDLYTFTIRPQAGLELLPALRAAFPDALLVAESGLSDPARARALADVGFGAFLVGSHFLTSGRPGPACAAFTAGLSPKPVSP